MTRLKLSALAGAAVLAFAPAAADAQDWNRDFGQQYGQEAYGYDLRGPFYAENQERNRYGQYLQHGPRDGASAARQQGWGDPSFGDDSRAPYNYYGPLFQQEPPGQFFQNRPSPPGVGGQQFASRGPGDQMPQTGSGGGQLGQPDVLFVNPVTGRATAFWLEDGSPQNDQRYGAWREQQVQDMDRAYEQWRADRIAEMDRNYEQWRNQQITAMDQRYDQDRSQAMAQSDRRYEQMRNQQAQGAGQRYQHGMRY